MNGTPQVADYLRILPEIVLSVFGMAVMLLDPVKNGPHPIEIPCGDNAGGEIGVYLARLTRGTCSQHA